MEVEGAGVVPDQGPAPAGGSGEALAGGKAGAAKPEAIMAGGAGEEEAGVGELEAPEVGWEQLQQVWELDVSAADEALSDLRRVGVMAGKRKRGDELVHQPVRHSLWEQDSLEAHNEVLFGYLDDEVGALRQRKAEYDEARRLSDGSDSCWSWSYSGGDSGSEAELEVNIEPLALEGAVVVATQGGEEGGAARELAGKRKRGDELAHQPVRHSLWEQDSLEAYSEVLFGCLDSEVEALRQRKAEYDEARRLSDGHYNSKARKTG